MANRSCCTIIWHGCLRAGLRAKKAHSTGKRMLASVLPSQHPPTSPEPPSFVHPPFFCPAQDTTPPAVTCPAPITVNTTSASGTIANYTLPAATDNCGPPAITCRPAPGATLPVGSTAVACNGTDASGNNASCGFNITVVLLPVDVAAGV